MKMEEKHEENKSINDYRMKWLIKAIAKNLEVDEPVVISMLNRNKGFLRKHLMDIFVRGTGKSIRPLERAGFYIYKTYYTKTFYKEVTILKKIPKPVTPPQSESPEDDFPIFQKKKVKKKKKKKKKDDDDSKSIEDASVPLESKDQVSESSASPPPDSANEMENENKNENDQDSPGNDSPKKKKDKKKKKKRIQSPQSVISAIAEPTMPQELEMITMTLKRIIKKEKKVAQLHSRIGDIYLDFTGEPTYFYFLLTTNTGIPIMDTWNEAKAEMPSYFIIGQLEKNLFHSFEETMKLLNNHFAHSFNDAFDPTSLNVCRKKKVLIQGESNVPLLDTIKPTGGFARQMIKILTQLKRENDYKENVTVDDLQFLDKLEEKPLKDAYGSQDIVKSSISGLSQDLQHLFTKIRSIKEIKSQPDFLAKEKVHAAHPIYNYFMNRFKIFVSFILWCNKNHKNKLMIQFPELPELENSTPELLYEIAKDDDFRMAIEDIVSQWTQYIYKLVESARNVEPSGKGPLPLHHYWSLNVEAFSPIYEDIYKSNIDKILKILEISESSKLEEFILARNALKAYYDVSLENTDYLNAAFTEIRLFLKCEKISEMAELLPQILEHLRVLWALSPHWGSEKYFSQLLDRVKWVVCFKIKRILNVQDLFSMNLDLVKKICINSAEFMDYWKKIYLDTRTKIEETECEPRWEFDKDRLFLETDYIATVARSLLEMVAAMQEHLSVFCPEFMHAVLDPTSIKLVIKKIWNLTVPIMTADFDIFDYEYSENWNIVIQGFWQGIYDLEEDALCVIQHSFKSLRSSGRAVKLLDQFHGFNTKGKIFELLYAKIDDVLSKFKDEIYMILNYFTGDCDKPPILRMHSVLGGAIAWTRQFFVSVYKNLKSIEESVIEPDPDKKEHTYQEFQKLINKLRNYECDVYNSWLEIELPYLKTAFQRNVIKLIELGEPVLNVSTFSDNSSEMDFSDTQMDERKQEIFNVIQNKSKPKYKKKKRKNKRMYTTEDIQIQKKLRRRQIKMAKLTGKEQYKYLSKSYVKKLASFSKQLKKLTKKRKQALELEEKRRNLKKELAFKRKTKSSATIHKSETTLMLEKELTTFRSGKNLMEFSKSNKNKKYKKMTDKEKRSRLRSESRKLKENLKHARKTLRKLKDKMDDLLLKNVKFREKKNSLKKCNSENKKEMMSKRLLKQKQRAIKWQKRQKMKMLRKKEKLEAKKTQIEDEIKSIGIRQNKLNKQLQELKYKKASQNIELFEEVKYTILDESETINKSTFQKRIKEVKNFEEKLLQYKQSQLEKVDFELNDIAESTNKTLQLEAESKLAKKIMPRIYFGCRHDVYWFSWREFIGNDLLIEHGYSIKLNYDHNFQRIVREAEIIDELGFPVPNEIFCLTTLKNLLHVEMHSIEYVVELYREIISKISKPQCVALKHLLLEIENLLNMGLTVHTWSSICVLDYTKTIISKLESLLIVLSQVKEVEKKFMIISRLTQKIEFFPFPTSSSIKPFPELILEIEATMEKAESLLAVQYDKMAPMIYKLQSIARLGNSGNCEQMSLHYKWAENIFFEAMTNMVLHNLLLFQEFLLGKFNTKFTIVVNLDRTGIIIDPPGHTLGYCLSLFIDKFLEKLSHFPRWYDGTCHQVAIVKNMNTGVVHQYAYIDDIVEVQIVKKCMEKIYDTIEFLITKINEEVAQWEKYSHLWKMNPSETIGLFVKEGHSLSEFDECFAFYHRLQKAMFLHKGHIDLFCVRIIVRPLVNVLISTTSEWKNILSEHLIESASQKAIELNEKFEILLSRVIQNTSSLDVFQEILQTIKEIGELQPEAECGFKYINDRMHLVRIWKCNVNHEKKKFYKMINDKYETLRLLAIYKNTSLTPIKRIYYKTTSDAAKNFKEECDNFTDQYFNEGPGTFMDDIESGLRLIPVYRDKFCELIKKQVSTLQAEKHFGLKPSNYSTFINAYNEFKNVEKVFEIYQLQKNFCNRWGKYLWVNLIPIRLMEGIDGFLKKFSDLPNECKQLPIADAIEQSFKDFKKTVPLMERLKNEAIRPRHWEELMHRTGQHIDMNSETFLLDNIFNINLHLYEDIIEELLGNAENELEVEININKINEVWSKTYLPVIIHYKQNQVHGFELGCIQDILNDLDDCCLSLKNTEKSQFSAPFLNEIQNWEFKLSLTTEVLNEWNYVQKKWLYLEGIFIDGDIRSQLATEARKFVEIDFKFSMIMVEVNGKNKLLEQCLKPGRLDELIALSVKIDSCKNSLGTYTNRKRNNFPRFYFMSDEELLSTLGSSVITTIQPYIIKIFDNIKQLKYKWEDAQNPGSLVKIEGLISCEEEEFNFKNPVTVVEGAESWMNKVLEEMKQTNKIITKEAVHNFGTVRRARSEWILDYFGMAIFVASKIWWTAEVEYAFRSFENGNIMAIKELGMRLNSQLVEITSKVSGKLSSCDRKKFTTVLMIDVHAREVVDTFISNNIINKQEFEWESQLRYYWVKSIDDILVKQCSGEFLFGYEYMGLHGRLVITPLTDRIYLTITQALSMHLGAAPMGPPGTGKTETVKDMAKAMGILCVVTNCGETMDYISFEKILNGLSQCGAWGCFDEFNRIEISVLSVISTQLHNVKNALHRKSKQFILDKCEIPLNSSVGIFITMNPGYSGSTELPESVKSLFRPVACMVPDLEQICMISLYSEGFSEAKVLAKKLTALLRLSKTILSKQNHYNFGLREIKSVLLMAGDLKRNIPDMPEVLVLMTCLWKQIVPTLICNDIFLYKELMKDIFPGYEYPKLEYPDFLKRVEKSLTDDNFLIVKSQVTKIVQLHETLLTRHSAMIVGSTGGGKSVIIKVLLAAQNLSGIKTQLFTINPKACNVNELYGNIHPITREWTDGLFSKIFREANQFNNSKLMKYIVFDGDVDGHWVESINSVMDDNKILTLANGERIKMSSQCILLFEVGDFQYTSPATLSRAGVVYVDPKKLGYRVYWQRWINTRLDIKEISMLDKYFDKYVPKCLSQIFTGSSDSIQIRPSLKLIIPQNELNLITQLCFMLEAFLPMADADQRDSVVERYTITELKKMDKALKPDKSEVEEHYSSLECVFINSLYFSLGACIIKEDRISFDLLVKNLSGMPIVDDSDAKKAEINSIPSNMPTLYEYTLDRKSGTWVAWKDLIPKYNHDNIKKFNDILVPTEDSSRLFWLLDLIRKINRPVLLIGETGTSKTATMIEYLNGLDPEKYDQLLMSFSHRTTSTDVLNLIESSIEKQTKEIYAPPNGKKLIAFIDDMNMPHMDDFGTKQPIALLKMLIDKKGLYSTQKHMKWKIIKDLSIFGAMGNTRGRENSVDPRFISLFAVYNMTYPSDSIITHIFLLILQGHTEKFEPDVKYNISDVLKMTMELFKCASLLLRPTPTKFHYTFHLRDLSKIVYGLLLADQHLFTTGAQFVRLWHNEFTRIIFDRLCTDSDRQKMRALISKKVEKYFPDIADYVLREPLLFGDYRNAMLRTQPRYYEDLLDYNAVFHLFTEISSEYNSHFTNINLVLFEDALDHLTRVHRVLRINRGHCMVIGVNGCGKDSIIRLASFAADCDLFSAVLVKGYDENNFKDDIKNLLGSLSTGNKAMTLLLTASQIINEGFLELANNLLTIGVSSSLFSKQDKFDIISKMKNVLNNTKDEKFDWWKHFTTICGDCLHIVLSMNPTSDSFRKQCRNFPGLIKNTYIDWIFPWPNKALYSVATKYLKDITYIPFELKEPIINCTILIHLSMFEYSNEYWLKYQRNNYLTPKHYLEFIKDYLNLMDKKYKEINFKCVGLNSGLKKIAEAKIRLDKLKDDLSNQKLVVLEKTKNLNSLTSEVNEAIKVVNDKKTLVTRKQTEIVNNQKLTEKLNREVELALSQAIPALQHAKLALEGIQEDDIVGLRSYTTPPEPVQVVCECIAILCGSKEINWKSSKTLMTDPMYLTKVKELNCNSIPQKTIHQVRTHLKVSKKLNELYKISLAGFSFLRFIEGLISYCAVLKEIKPKKEKVVELAESNEQIEVYLNNLLIEIASLEISLTDITAKQTEAKEEKAKIFFVTDLMEKRLHAADKLFKGLVIENERWVKSLEDIQEEKREVLGNSLLCAAFFSYAGPFIWEMRQEMLYEKWFTFVTEAKIPVSISFCIERYLIDDKTLSIWNSEGLETDELTLQNGILTTYPSRFPICIDPQQQAVTWIKGKEGKRNLKILSFNDNEFLKHFQSAIKYGYPVLMPDVDYVDPVIGNVLEQKLKVDSGKMYVELAGKMVEYNSKFKLYITTKMPNPSFVEGLYSKGTVIYYSVTKPALEERLLSIAVRNEVPDIEESRDTLLSDIISKNILVQELESSIVSGLASSEKNILDSEDLVQQLENTKKRVKEVQMELQLAKQTKADIDINRNIYNPVAKCGAILFFLLFELSALNPMYQFSLNSYLRLYAHSIKQVNIVTDVSIRIINITSNLTKQVYDYGCTGIFEKHKLLLSLQLVIKLDKSPIKITHEEMVFFIHGNTVKSTSKLNSPFKWLTDKGWNDVLKLSESFDTFHDLIIQFNNHPQSWEKWCQTDMPESVPLPNGYSNKLSSFELLMLIRCLRVDRVYQCVTDYVKNNIGESYITPPYVSFTKIYQQSSNFNPVIFILSPGTDPYMNMIKFAEENHIGEKFKCLSLGQGQEMLATKMMEEAACLGEWLMLQNCHLLISFVRELEKKFEKITSPHHTFRLWLTTEQTDDFPIGMLQSCFKVVMESPSGLKLNLRNSYFKMDESLLTSNNHPSFKSLIYILTFFHAVVQERRKYGKAGWNINYDFSDSDYSVSIEIIKNYLERALYTDEKRVPWDSLKCLIEEVVYGGRVIDHYDRRIINTYMDVYMGDFAFDTFQSFHFYSNSDTVYSIPPEGSKNDYLDYIESLDSNCSPECYGLHWNAQLEYYTDTAKELWFSLKKLQPQADTSSTTESYDTMVDNIAAEIYTIVPEPIDSSKVVIIYTSESSPLCSFLTHEINKFNVLTSKMKANLTSLRKAIEGEIGMDAVLEKMSLSLYQGELPFEWANLSHYKTKDLGRWLQFFKQQSAQFTDWVALGEPIAVWLAGFQIPEAYLTALIQKSCRSEGWAIDEASFKTSVTQFQHEDEVISKPANGCYLYGLFLEGARWDEFKNFITSSLPQILTEPLPLLFFEPIAKASQPNDFLLPTPVYMSSARRNVQGEGFVFEAQLPIAIHQSIWILQGVCLLMVLCGPDLKIMDLVARWPGSAHDNHVFSNSRLYSRLESGEFGTDVVLGDSGYPNKNFLLTPLQSINTEGENLYNEAQIRTRNVVERCFGAWKRQFPVLSLGVRLNLPTVMTIIVATAVVHNLAIDCNVGEAPEESTVDEETSLSQGLPLQLCMDFLQDLSHLHFPLQLYGNIKKLKL